MGFNCTTNTLRNPFWFHSVFKMNIILTSHIKLIMWRVFLGTCQRSMGPPALHFFDFSPSSSHGAAEVVDHSVVTGISATITADTIYSQPFSRLCCFLPTTTECINRDFSDGMKVIYCLFPEDVCVFVLIHNPCRVRSGTVVHKILTSCDFIGGLCEKGSVMRWIK